MASRASVLIGCVFAAAFVGTATAQADTVAAGPAKEVLRIPTPLQCDKLTVADGMPISNVTDFVQDKLGFMWIGTPEGLVRYDGIHMRVYRPIDNDPTSISSGSITALELDADGKLWVGTSDKGIDLYDPTTDAFTRFLASETAGSPSSDGITAILRDRKDRIWFAMGGGGLNRYDAASKKFVDYHADVLGTTFTSMDDDPGGSIWLASAEDGLIKWDPDSNKSTVLTPDQLEVGSTLNDVLVASTGKIWVGAELDGVRVVDPATSKVTHIVNAEGDAGTIGSDRINRIYEAANKAMWVGTNSGLNRIDPDGRVTRFDYDPTDPSALAFPEVLAMYQDRGGVLWFGGLTVGICKVNEEKLQFGYHRTRHGSYPTSFAEDAGGAIWVGTYNDGLYRYDTAKQTETVYYRLEHRADGQPGMVDLTKDTWLNALHADHNGTLWLSIRGLGLIAFDPKTETYKEFRYDSEKSGGLPYHTIHDIWEDHRGTLWLAMWGASSAGLVRFDPSLETFTSYTVANNIGLSSDSYFQIYPDRAEQDILWLATDGGGLGRLDLTAGKATSFRTSNDPKSIGSDTVMSIVQAKDGTLWLGTSNGGLNHFDPKTSTFERFTTSNSKLTNNTILGVLQDDSGALWLGTNGGGLVRFDPATKTFTVYTSGDGAQDEFNQCSFLRTSKGEMVFGGPAGWNGFNPKGITRDEYKPPVVLTSFKVGNQEVKLARPIWASPPLRVSYADTFEIQFAALAFAAPKQNRYAFKLEGYDDDFRETDRPFAQYGKLPGGKYTLRVRASNRHGVWSDVPVALTIAVTPPWYRTWQAFLGYMVVLFGAAYMIYRWQRARVQMAEREGRLAVVERDLELTGAVQSGFLPENNDINIGRLHVFGLYRPADACGGDWWWHESLPNGKQIVMVGDVTGHGPGPAMVTAAVATAFRVLAENGLEDAMHALEVLNKEVLRVAKGKYHMTMAALEVDDETGHWTLYSAGAPPMLVLNPNGKHRVAFCPGAPLGTENGFEAGRLEGKLDPQSRIMLYTDGIPELEQPNGNPLGMRKFAQQYELTKGHPLPSAAALILTQADVARGGVPQGDDWTFTLVEWH